MDGNIKKVERQYDKLAHEWAKVFCGEHDKKPKDREVLERFAELTGEGRPVWDLACGVGNTSAFLKNRGIEISGLDISEKMLQQARAIHGDVVFQKGDILQLPFDDDSIAAIVAFYAIVHFTEKEVEIALSEIFRVLKARGIFLFTFHIGEGKIHVDHFLGKKVDMDLVLFKREFISGCLKKMGFEKIEIMERDPYEGIEYGTRRAYVFARKLN